MPSEFASFSRAPIAVTVAGVRVSLPYQPAAVWIQALAKLNVLCSELAPAREREVLIDLVMESDSAVTDLERESLRILGEATGLKWWEAGRLISTSASSEVLGRMVLAGVDPWQRSIGEWCAAVYALCVKGQDEKGRIKFDFSLSVPPPDYTDEWDDGGEDPGAFLAQLKR